MRKVFIALVVLALAGTAFFVYAAIHQHGNVQRELDWSEKQLAELKKVVEDPSLTPEAKDELSKRRAESVELTIDEIRHYKDERNKCLAFGAGTLVLATVFGVLARRKRKASGVTAVA
jgi:hypothetical protein